jgi:hypothetical protein
MDIPEVRIMYSEFLDTRIQQLFNGQQKAGLIPLEKVYPAPELILEKAKAYQAAWEPRKLVLAYTQEILSLHFYANVIDAYAVGFMKGPFSLPIVIDSNPPPDVYIDILTHEIVHRLISDNTQKVRGEKIARAMFPEETVMCAIHVVIHAMLKKVYVEFLGDSQRLAADKQRVKKGPDYTRAWELVESLGENKIIEQFKSYYMH